MNYIETLLLDVPFQSGYFQNNLFEYFNFFEERFFLDKELNEINSIIQEKTIDLKLWIQGYAGCGKTTLAKKIAAQLQEANKTVLYLDEAYFYTISYNSHMSLDSIEKLKNKIVDYDYLIIDGLYELKQLDKIFEFGKNFYNIIVFSRKPPIDASFLLYKIDPSSFDIHSILNSRFEKLSSICNLENIVKKICDDALLSYDIYKQEHTTSDELNKIILPAKELVLPPQKIITDLSIINNSFLDEVKDNPTKIYELTPREFEELVCEIFQKRGYDVTLTKKTKDGGKDLIVLNNCFLGGFLVYVECKKYSPQRPVSVKLVRELYGTVSADKATAGILISTSYFSREAVSFQQRVPNQMKLIDYKELIQKIKETV
ncbi:MAG: restriction endonuclease [Clostridia bacterium]|nr:restriction endonuclease [Clostridia bacterium]